MRSMAFRRASLLTIALCAAVGACAGSGGGSGAPRSSSSSLGSEELEADAALDLYTVVQRRRPQWLRNRATTTSQGRAEIAVLIDGVRQQGSVEVLRSLRAGDVDQVRFLNARDATTRYGTDMTAGAILVTTKR